MIRFTPNTNLYLRQMKKIYGFLTILMLLIQNNISAQKSNFSDLIISKSNQIEKKVIAWRRDFHQNPELGNREVRTADIVAKHLQSLGFEVRTRVAYTGVVAVLKGGKPGPVIALRADMDALPVEEVSTLPFASKVKVDYNGKMTSIMHACGHDAHTAILMGVAEVLASMKNDICGTVKFIFQPAEEGAPEGEEAGAALMIKEGALENPKVDIVFGLHLDAQLEANKLSYCPGGTFAGVSNFKITVKGKSGHGSQPWLSIDPILTSAQIITSLQQIVSRNVQLIQNPAVLTVGMISGGNRTNVIPAEVEFAGDIRTFSPGDEKLFYKRIVQIAEKTAEAAGATAVVQIPYIDRYPVTFNNLALTKAMLPSLEKSASKENVVLVRPATLAEDFSFFAEKVPGLYFRLGALPKGKDSATSGSHHTADFFIDEASFKTGVIAFCNLVFDYPNTIVTK